MENLLKKIVFLLKQALEEDIGEGDVTTEATIPDHLQGKLVVKVKAPGIICGLSVFEKLYQLLDRSVLVNILKKDGDRLNAGDRVAIVSGPLRSLLTGERVALNFLQRLSGIATFTARFVTIANRYGIKVYDTRKTTPLWRALEKYAVRIGGGYNHRFGLYDMILIKDNHIDACGDIVNAVAKAVAYNQKQRRKLKIGVEVRTLAELHAILPFPVDLILLDNMPLKTIRKAMAIIGRAEKPEVEVSGGITLKRLKALGQAGVRRVSIGALTHSAPALDIACDYEK